jgi:heme exporter protein B
MLTKAVALFYKDFQSELRTRYAVNSLVMFILVAVSVILFSIGNEKVTPGLTAGLYWVTVFFASMSGLSRVFVSEEDRGTSLTLQLLASPSTILTGKLLFNLVLIFLIDFFITILFFIFFSSFVLLNFALFIVVFIFSNFGLAVSSTIIASIIAKTSSRGSLYSVLSFPIILPLLIESVQLTLNAINGASFGDSRVELLIIGCYDVVMITASYMLFDLIWKE